jgi:hypothetical protein
MLDPPLAHNQLKPFSTIAGLKPGTHHTWFYFPQWNKNYNKCRPLCESRASKARRPRYKLRSVASWIPPRAYERLSVIITFTLPAGWTYGYSTLAHPWRSKCFSLKPVTANYLHTKANHARHLRILDLSNRWKWAMSFILQILSPPPQLRDPRTRTQIESSKSSFLPLQSYHGFWKHGYKIGRQALLFTSVVSS